MPGLDVHGDSGGASWSPVRPTEGSCPDPQEQEEIADRLQREADGPANFKEGAIFNVVSLRWYKQWKEYVEFAGKAQGQAYDTEMMDAFQTKGGSSTPARPGPIDNSPLLDVLTEADNGGLAISGGQTEAEGTSWQLCRDLQEEFQYVLVPHAVWEALESWYQGGPEIRRTVISTGNRGDLSVEVYPLLLQLVLSSNLSQRRLLMISKRATVGELQQKAAELFRKPVDQFRLWDCFGGKRQGLLEDMAQALEDASLQMDNEILVEERLPDGNWPEGAAAAPLQSAHSQGAPMAPPGAPGVGLLLASNQSIAGGPLSPYAPDTEATDSAMEDGEEELGESTGEGSGIGFPSSALTSLVQENAGPRVGAPGGAPRASAASVGTSAESPLLTVGSGSSGSQVAGINRLRDGGSSGVASSSTSSGRSSGGGIGMTTRSSLLQGRPGGLTGLVNLGNTCFMNSALQCLVHTPPLVSFFQSDYHPQINRRNPLGMQGELALAFGDLLRRLWSPSQEAVAPRQFKGVLSRFAPQFSGYNQHDSQELLAFLLDGLHEDLNRVERKPYIEAKDADGRPDDLVAQEYWDNHKARNDSIIVDTCQGQYKSTLVCPVCSKVSVTFDPFMYLSLPLPAKSSRSMTVTVIAADGSSGPCTLTTNVLKAGSVADLVRNLSQELPLEASEQIFLTEIYSNKVYRVFTPQDLLSTIQDHDKIVAYRIPRDCINPVIVNQRMRTNGTAGLNFNFNWTATGTPLVLPESRVKIETGEQLYRLVRDVVRPFRTAKAGGGAGHGDASIDGVEDAKGKGPVQQSAGDGLISGMEDEAAEASAGADGEGGAGAEGETEGPAGDGTPMAEESARAPEAATAEGGLPLPGGGVTMMDSSPRQSHEGGDGIRRADGAVEGSGHEQGAPGRAGGDVSAQGVGAAASAGAGVAAEGGKGGKGATQQRVSNGFLLKICHAEKRNEWLEMPDCADPLPDEFFIAGTLPRELQPVSLDWAPRALHQMYDIRALDDLPSAAASQTFWSRLPSRISQAIPGMGAKGKEGITLYSCLDAFLKEEPLGPDDMWYCPRCKEHRQATKKLDLWRLPDILVVHLKRFSYSRYFKNKIDALVDFPLKGLDLTPYIRAGKGAPEGPPGARNAAHAAAAAGPAQSTPAGAAPGLAQASAGVAAVPDPAVSAAAGEGKGRAARASEGGKGPAADGAQAGEAPGKERYLYDLFAVSNHFGGMGGGHYTAYAKLSGDGKWHCFDDSYVSPTTASHVKSPAAYVLFYQRSNTGAK